MLPKVNRDESTINVTGVDGTSKVRMLSATSVGGVGSGISGSIGKTIRRPISTKAAHVTTIPLEPTFLSSATTNTAPLNRPYLPYSPISPIRARQNSHRVQQEQQKNVPSPKWKGGQDGYKSEYANNNRARAHSHRNLHGKTWSARGTQGVSAEKSNSMPYLVPKTAKQKLPASSSSTNNKPPASSSDHQHSNDEKVVINPEELQTAAIQLVGGGMVMMGTGKPAAAMNVNSGPVASSLTKDRVQVCRTREEKEKNPDSIRLDKRGVRVFPDIGGGESTTLKLLSLQHNLITRMENVPLLSQLVVLDLYDNRVERISGLQGLPSLRVLLLGKNRIKRIEGLDSLKRLEILDLHGNQLRYVDNLGSLSSLRVLNLAGNLLRNIRNLGSYGMSSLTELNLKRNRIKNLEGLHKAPHLKKLLIANNDLQNIAALAPLRKLFHLNELVIEPNPLVGSIGSEYQSQVLTIFPNLGLLDRISITDDMKLEAKLWHKRKLQEEEARKIEEERIQQEMAAAVGPPGSREQVIYQARRRWESLKNFIKSSGNNPQPPESSLKITKSSMKSMKKVVAVATNVEAKKQAELLYPPSTLDLEEFPDGQQKLDQMESMISSQKFHEDSQSRIAKQSEISVLGHYEKEDKLLKEIQVTLHKAEVETSPVIIRHNSVIHEEPVEKASSGSAGSTGKTLTNDLPNIVGENGEEEEDIPLLENQSSTSCSARSNSAKVAIVRPLPRSATLQTITSPDIANSSTKLSPQTVAHNDDDVEFSNVNIIVSSMSSNETTTVVLMAQDFTQVVTTTINEAETSIPKPMENGTLSLLDPPPVVVHGATSSPDLTYLYTCSESGEKDNNEIAHQQTVELQAPQTIQSESSRVKAKLLKHLRSISLDSYPHPFLRPDGHKPGDASSTNSASPMIPSDDDDGEEDDDNDNEVVQDYDDDDAYSIATSTGTAGTSGSTPRRSNTVVATTNRLLKNGVVRKQTFPRTRSQRIKIRDRAAKLFGSTSDLNPKSPAGTTVKRVNSGTGTRGESSGGRLATFGRILRRCDSAASLSSSGLVSSIATTMVVPGTNNTPNNTQSRMTGGGQTGTDVDNQSGGTSAFRKQGMDFLVEVEGKMLNVFGQGGLRHALTAFASNVTCHVSTAKFHYISYDSIIPFFGKLRQVYPSLEHFHFRANNLGAIAQLDALSDLQGLTSLFIAKEGNPVVNHEAWAHYASYRLSHWGLQVINGKEVSSEYRGGASPAAQAKGFESLGFLALSCLPQTALTPLAKRLHMLHCFCCCSPSTSSDESNRKLAATQQHARLLHSPSQATTDHGSNGNFCTSWDDDPVLLDVIGKEALVYCPPVLPLEIDASNTTLMNKPEFNPPSQYAAIGTCSHEKRRAETLGNLINAGVEIVEKVDRLENIWPTLMTEAIQEMLMDFRFMDQYMKKELKKAQNITLINQQQQYHHNSGHHQHGRKFRH